MALQEVTALVPVNVAVVMHLNDHGGDPAVTAQCTMEVFALDAAGQVLSSQSADLFDLVTQARRTQVLAFMAEVRAIALEVLP